MRITWRVFLWEYGLAIILLLVFPLLHSWFYGTADSVWWASIALCVCVPSAIVAHMHLRRSELASAKEPREEAELVSAVRDEERGW